MRRILYRTTRQIPALFAGVFIVAVAAAFSYLGAGHGGDEAPSSAESRSLGESLKSGQTIERRVVAETFISSGGAKDLETLVKLSHVIAIGKVIEAEIIERPTYIKNPFPERPGHTQGHPDDILVTLDYRTRYLVSAELILKTDATTPREEPPATFAVTDLGAIEGGTAYIEGDAPVYDVGRRYLFFLLRHPRDPGRLVTAVGRYSQFFLQGETVRPGDGLFAVAESDLSGAQHQLNGMNEGEVVSLIERLVVRTR